MATRIAVIGPVNTGKSMSRRNLDPNEVFIIAPTAKSLHLKQPDGSPLPRLNVKTKQSKNIEEVIQSLRANKINVSSPEDVCAYLYANRKKMKEVSGLEVTGSWMLCKDMNSISNIQRFVAEYLPEKKIIIQPDYTHYVSNRVSGAQFIQRKSGGEAFQRFYELASDSLNHFIASADNLPEDMLVITEYHADLDENTGEYKVFVNAGKMLEEKFKPESYYDFIFYTHIDVDEDGEVTPDSYKFVTKRWKNYPARSAGLFEETLIPNDLAPVVQKVREYQGIIKPEKIKV